MDDVGDHVHWPRIDNCRLSKLPVLLRRLKLVLAVKNKSVRLSEVCETVKVAYLYYITIIIFMWVSEIGYDRKYDENESGLSAEFLC